MSNDPDSRLREHLEKCKVPLSKDDWIGFRKDLEAQRLATCFALWFERQRKWFEWVSKKKLDNETVKDSLILALRQLTELRSTVRVLEHLLKDGEAGLHKRMKQWELQEAKKKRDLKPAAPGVTKNWLELMPIYNDGEPCGYVQATGQTRKVIGNFIRSIKAKPTSKLVKKKRGKRKRLHEFETNCRVLDQWLREWCDQEPEKKYAVVLREALILAAAVADSKIPVNEKRLARLRRILTTQAQPAAKQNGTDSSFDFLASASACREKYPPPVEIPFEQRFLAYINKVLAGEPTGECPLP